MIKELENYMIENDGEHIRRLFYIQDRWQDEKEYEDFEEYKAAAAKIFEGSHYRFVKMTRAFLVTLETNQGQRLYTLTIKPTKDGFEITKQEKVVA